MSCKDILSECQDLSEWKIEENVVTGEPHVSNLVTILFVYKVWCFHSSRINNSELCDVALCIACEIYQGFEGFAKLVFGDLPWGFLKKVGIHLPTRMALYIVWPTSTPFMSFKFLTRWDSIVKSDKVRFNIKVKPDKLYALYLIDIEINQSSWQFFLNLEQRRKINKIRH